MEVKIERDVLNELKDEYIKSKKSAVRFVYADIDCSCSPSFKIEFGDIKKDDYVFEYEGIKFATEKQNYYLIGTPEIIKTDNGLEVKKISCCMRY